MKPEIKGIHQNIESIVEKLLTAKNILDGMVGDLHLVHMKVSQFRNAGEIPTEVLALGTSVQELEDSIRLLHGSVQGHKSLTTDLALESQRISHEAPVGASRPHYAER